MKLLQKKYVQGMSLTITFAAFVGMAGCGKSDEQKVAEALVKQGLEVSKQLEDAEKKGGASVNMNIGQTGQTGNVEVVDFRELKAILPEILLGMPRGEAQGTKTNVMGIGVSQAEARYNDSQNGRSIRIQLMDYSQSTGMSLAFAWMNMDMETETDHGWEKTGVEGNRRFHQKYEKRGNSSSAEYSVVVGNRFLVQLDADGLDMPALKQAVASLNLNKLESLAGKH